MILRHTFTPHNNTRLTHLCGPADAHLRTIEVALEVSIAHRHEQFKVDGPKAKATQAMELLQALYEMAERPIPEDTLQIMLAGDSGLIEAPEGAIVLNTRRADLRGRTPTQSLYLQNIASHDITFGIGPAGTGKTYLAVACAVDALERSAGEQLRGAVLLIDLHSMPPLGLRHPGDRPTEFVVGDRFGASCSHRLSATALDWFARGGRVAVHNRPYAGGYVLDRHAAPARGIHALQVEICRTSYLDARLAEPSARFGSVARTLASLVRTLAADVSLMSGSRFPLAAE